jgi:anti-sigma factor RsiW
MNRFFDPCRRHRQDLSLLAAGALPETEKERVEIHLAECANCRKYFEEIKAMTVSLTSLAGNVPHVQPSEFARTRWSKAILAAARPEPVHQLTPAMAFREWWREVIWARRRIWAGLAAIWVIILAGNLSLSGQGQTFAGKSSPQETITAFKDQQKILAELLVNRSATHDAEPPKLFSPGPRTETSMVMTT